jgi:hypothetical protein
LLRCTLVANGTKRHFAAAQQMVAFGVKADIKGDGYFQASRRCAAGCKKF